MTADQTAATVGAWALERLTIGRSAHMALRRRNVDFHSLTCVSKASARHGRPVVADRPALGGRRFNLHVRPNSKRLQCDPNPRAQLRVKSERLRARGWGRMSLCVGRRERKVELNPRPLMTCAIRPRSCALECCCSRPPTRGGRPMAAGAPRNNLTSRDPKVRAGCSFAGELPVRLKVVGAPVAQPWAEYGQPQQHP